MRGLSPASAKPRAQIIEEQRIEHLQDIRHAGVVHAQRAALLVLCDRLDHRAENVRVDLFPVEIADVEEIGARDPAESAAHPCCPRTIRRSHREKRRPNGALWRLARSAIFVFIARNSSPITSWVLDDPARSSARSSREKIVADKMSVSLGEEAEDQPRHEMVHVVPPRRRSPFGVLFQKLDIELVQAAGGPDVERVVADLLDGRDAGERQEKAEMIGKSG